MTVTVPSVAIRYGSYYITVVSGAGTTVTLNAGAPIVDGAVAGQAGGSLDYIESGGVVSNNGSGPDTYYVKSGGTLNGSGGGGGNVAYAEPGANVTLPGVSTVAVPSLCMSPVTALFQITSPGPAVTTGNATNVEFTDAQANGTVDGLGSQSAAYFQYGTTTSYGSQTAAVGTQGGAVQTVPVSADLSNLTPNTLYHFRLAATNSGVTNYGADATFTTAALSGGGPGILNEAASGVTYSAATLNAAVDPNGAATTVTFQYGLSAAYGSTTASQSLASGTTDVAVQAPLTSLLPDTTYHYCVIATNGNATTTGSDQTFQTGAVGISGFAPAQAAAGATLTLSGVGFTGATGVEFNQLGTVTSGTFVVLSDTAMAVTVPACGVRGGSYYITVITNAGITVTLDPATLPVENGGTAGSGGGAVIYLESGATATNNGSGGETYYVKNGGAVNGSGGGGGNVAYAEPGANVTLPGVTVVSEPNVSQSPVPALFKFLAPGRAVTGAASNIAINNATTTGTVNAEGCATTACVQYGVESASGAQGNVAMMKAVHSLAATPQDTVTYPEQTPPVSIGSGTSDMPLAINLTGLTSNTTYHFRVAVTNGAGTTYGADQQFTTNPGPHDFWNENYFSAAQLANPAISGAMAAPAGDGISNLMKYALGMNPMVQSASGLPAGGTAVIGGANCLTFTYTKMDAATDITYVPQWSTDLVNWSTTGFTQTVLSDNGTSQQVQASILVTGTQPVFFQLQVTMP
jgi:hypothetical protein